MRLKYQYILTQLGDEFAAVPIDDPPYGEHIVIFLSNAGKAIWQAITDGQDKDAIAEQIAGLYKIDQAAARKRAQKIIDQLLAHDLVEN